MCPQPANPNLAILTYKFDWMHGKVRAPFIYCNNNTIRSTKKCDLKNETW